MFSCNGLKCFLLGDPGIVVLLGIHHYRHLHVEVGCAADLVAQQQVIKDHRLLVEFGALLVNAVHHLDHIRIPAHFNSGFVRLEFKISDHTRHAVHLCAEVRQVSAVDHIAAPHAELDFAVHRDVEFVFNSKVIIAHGVGSVHAYRIASDRKSVV